MDRPPTPPPLASGLQDFHEAASAVKAERRASSKSLVLLCQKVEAVGGPHDRLFVLEVTRFARMNWTWEGARAFAGGVDEEGEFTRPEWGGEVVQVDEVESKLYVAMDDEEARPTVGELVVQPFDFLEALDSLYNQEFAADLQPHLSEALGRAVGENPGHPIPLASTSPNLVGVWDHSLGHVWGPPGTGKTYQLGEQVADALADLDDKILVVSTTNKATDIAALSIGRALRQRGVEPTEEMVRRVGSGADSRAFRAQRLEHILDSDPLGVRDKLSKLLRVYRKTTDPGERARQWAEITEVRKSLSGKMGRLGEVESRVVVATSFLGMCGLADEVTLAEILEGEIPFTTVIADEAGLLSRASIAALSLWGSRRMVLFGDPRQLSPISRISRVLAPTRARWIARSGLDHLQPGEQPGLRLLTTQYRMHPEVREVVSSYLYEGRLQDADEVRERSQRWSKDSQELDKVGMARAVWYVLDEDTPNLPAIRADRGPGGKSWCRRRSREIVERIFRAHPFLRDKSGMFVSPFVAQARDLARFFAESDLDSWMASTTHAQQGAEADVVLFDTVHASSTAWCHEEWQRLINVGMSRARELLILLSSRLEMGETYLRPLVGSLSPRAIRGSGGKLRWQEVPARVPPHESSRQRREENPHSLGAQVESRKQLRPILGAEQQRLCHYPIDGKPRLVRGVAGSGKTAVLAHWLARRVAEQGEAGPYMVVYANQALKGLIQSQVDQVWESLDQGMPFPWDGVQIFHVLELLEKLEGERGWPRLRGNDRFDFEARAEKLLVTPIQPLCQAMFVDEAQDCGDTTIALLAKLVKPTDPEEGKQRAINIFYDNAQNVYGRGTPRWVDLGIDMVGRSTVMKESYRSTLPATEYALNVLYRLQDPEGDPDHNELVSRDLIHKEERGGNPWWRVRFNEVDGPLPEFKKYPDREAELDALCKRVVDWIDKEGVRPGDIRILYNSRKSCEEILGTLTPALRRIGVRVESRTSEKMVGEEDLVLVTTAHSFKGYDSEIIAVMGADRFVAKIAGVKQVLHHPLYVAMTRARSVLYVSAIARSPGCPAAEVVAALQSVFEDQRSVPEKAPACTAREEHLEIVERIGPEHREWFQGIADSHAIATGPILRSDRSIVAEPLFRWGEGGQEYACFCERPTPYVEQEMVEVGVRAVVPGEG